MEARKMKINMKGTFRKNLNFLWGILWAIYFLCAATLKKPIF